MVKLQEGTTTIPSVIELSDALEYLRFFGLIRSIDVSFNDAKRVSLNSELEERP
ncbi:hypothetical protein ACFOPX_04720 [Helicobacter baculiformis]|uniref:Uncharacterized protein n=1 Tax=Helicobacter baculiformis TaxID=427351 RepID=A0ABV7ZI34_9HELI|nr:hypothetical protein [Helicobacter baculiformis]